MKYYFASTRKNLPKSLRRDSVVDTDGVIFNGSFGNQNPDQLLIDRNQTLEMYQDMARDPVVIQALELRIYSSISNYIVEPAEETDDSELHAAFIKDNLENHMERDFIPTMRDIILQGHINGFVVCDPIFDIVESSIKGNKGIWNMITRIKVKNSDNFEFDLDEYKNIQQIRYREGALVDALDDVIDKNRVFIYTHNPQFEDPHGRSALRRVFRAFWIKDKVEKWWASFMEKYAMPFKKATFDKDAIASDGLVSDLISFIKKWTSDDGGVLPPGTDVELLEVGSKADAAALFGQIIAHQNSEIVIGLTGGELNMMKGDSRAEGQIHERGFQIIKDFVRREAETFTNDVIIPRLMRLNFNTNRFPKVRYVDPQIPVNRKLFAEGLVESLKMIDIPERWLRQTLQIPEIKDGEKVIEKIPVFQPIAGGGADVGGKPGDAPPEEKTPSDEENKTPKDPE